VTVTFFNGISYRLGTKRELNPKIQPAKD